MREDQGIFVKKQIIIFKKKLIYRKKPKTKTFTNSHQNYSSAFTCKLTIALNTLSKKLLFISPRFTDHARICLSLDNPASFLSRLGIETVVIFRFFY